MAAATRILVVEDEFLIALDIAGVLEQAGLAVSARPALSATRLRPSRRRRCMARCSTRILPASRSDAWPTR